MVLRDWFWITSWLAPSTPFSEMASFPRILNLRNWEAGSGSQRKQTAEVMKEVAHWLIVLFYQWCDPTFSVTLKLKAPEKPDIGSCVVWTDPNLFKLLQQNAMVWVSSKHWPTFKAPGESVFVGGPLHLYMARGISFMKVFFLHSIITSQILVY